MTKSIFIFLVVFALVGTTVWLLVRKSREVQTGVGSVGTLTSNSPSPSASSTGSGQGSSVKLGNGLEIQDIIIGPGPEVHTGDIVAVNYVGTLEDGTKFDSSYDRGQPFPFIIGKGSVIQGWDLGVPGMKIGGKRKLIIPPELGYGDKGAGGIIPPNATLIFEIELVDARSGGQ